MWEYEHTVISEASAAAVYACYADVATWRAWDESVEAVELRGPFAAGTAGTLRLHGQPPMSFRIVSAEAGSRYVDETDVAGLVVSFDHRLTGLPEGRTSITHHVTVDGAGQAPSPEELGPMIISDMPSSMEALARYAASRTVTG